MPAILYIIFLLLVSITAENSYAQKWPRVEQVQNVWVEIIPPRIGVLRAITTGRRCPVARFNNRRVRLKVRAKPNSDFNVLVCERRIPFDVKDIRIAGRQLRPVPSRPQRIAVVGDTGCRMKSGSSLDDGFQNCNDPNDWEFAKVAEQVAAWKPDLIIQVGDYIYREEQCPAECAHCQGSPYNSPGMRMQTWNAEFFNPAKPLLEAAPVVFVRGDHEKCSRAGGGYFRFLDPFKFGACMDFSDPYALNFQGLQLLIMDTVEADDTSLSPTVVIERYAQDFEKAAKLVKSNTWLLSHRPIWFFRPTPVPNSQTVTDECGNQTIPPLTVQDINVSVHQALESSSLAGQLPSPIDLVIAGHIHVGAILSFSGQRAPQMVVGISGTKLLPVAPDELVGMELEGEFVTDATMLSTHGFFGFTWVPRGSWHTDVLDVSGNEVVACDVMDKSAVCMTP